MGLWVDLLTPRSQKTCRPPPLLPLLLRLSLEFLDVKDKEGNRAWSCFQSPTQGNSVKSHSEAVSGGVPQGEGGEQLHLN